MWQTTAHSLATHAKYNTFASDTRVTPSEYLWLRWLLGIQSVHVALFSCVHIALQSPTRYYACSEYAQKKEKT